MEVGEKQRKIPAKTHVLLSTLQMTEVSPFTWHSEFFVQPVAGEMPAGGPTLTENVGDGPEGNKIVCKFFEKPLTARAHS